MIPNSKSCKRGKCKLYPCNKSYGECQNQLAFNSRGEWFIARPIVAKYLNNRMKKELDRDNRGLALNVKVW